MNHEVRDKNVNYMADRRRKSRYLKIALIYSLVKQTKCKLTKKKRIISREHKRNAKYFTTFLKKKKIITGE